MERSILFWCLALYFTVMAVCLWILNRIGAIHWLQVTVLLLSGMVQMYAGLCLFKADSGKSFKNVEGVIAMVPMMMDMKGNLEVAMASRISIMANTSDEMKSFGGLANAVMKNAILIQTQVTLVSFLAVGITIFYIWISSGHFLTLNRIVMLYAIALCTSSLTCSGLGSILTVFVSIVSRSGQDPNDVATSMAASLGDLLTVLLVVFFTNLFYYSECNQNRWIYYVVPTLILMLLPVLLYAINQNSDIKRVLSQCWLPLALSTVISMVAGFVLESKSERFKQMTIMLPLLAGLLGNSISVITSLIGTTFRLEPGRPVRPFVSPNQVFGKYESNEKVSSSSRSMVIYAVVPCLFIYLMIIAIFQPQYIRITVTFVTLYLGCAVILMVLMIYLTVNMIHLGYQYELDPSDNVIPVMTSVIDMFASFMLWIQYEILAGISDPNASISIHNTSNTNKMALHRQSFFVSSS